MMIMMIVFSFPSGLFHRIFHKQHSNNLLYVFVCKEMMMNNGWICTMYFKRRTNRYAPKSNKKKKKLQRKRRRKRYIIIGWRFLYFVTLVYWLPTFSTCYTAGQNDDDNTFRSKNMGFTLQVDDQWIYTEKHTRNFFPSCTQSIRYPFKVFSCHKFPIPDWHPKHLTFFITIIILPASLD